MNLSYYFVFFDFLFLIIFTITAITITIIVAIKANTPISIVSKNKLDRSVRKKIISFNFKIWGN
jgi:hypothetical protein